MTMEAYQICDMVAREGGEAKRNASRLASIIQRNDEAVWEALMVLAAEIDKLHPRYKNKVSKTLERILKRNRKEK